MWTAFVPEPDQVPYHLRQRCSNLTLIFVRGPRRDAFQEEYTQFFQKAKVEGVESLEQFEEDNAAFEVALDNSIDDQFAYWCLICPPKMILDNYVVSKRKYQIPTQVQKMVNVEGSKKLYGMMAYWTIVEKSDGVDLRGKKGRKSLGDILADSDDDAPTTNK
jgi:hypothetical protein